MAKIFVVMTNDFPDCVFDVEWKAEIYVEMQQSWQKMHTSYGARIYYRYYEFEVNEPGRRMAQATSEWGSTREPTNADQEEFRATLRARWNERRPTKSPSA
jgi:hypothetical protein